MKFKKPKPIPRAKPTRAAVPVIEGFPGVIAGFPDFWQKVHDRYPAFFAAAVDLRPLVNSFLHKPVKEPLHFVLHFLAAIVANSLGALLTLALNGYGHDAVRISRGMFEAAVNAAYLNRHPDELDDYKDYHWVRQKKLYEYFQQYAPSELARIPPTTISELDIEFTRVSPRFKGARGNLRPTWCKKHLRARAEEVGLGQFYPTFYSLASGIHHADIGGLVAQSTKDGVEIAPSFAKVKEALMMGHQAVIHVLCSFNDAAALGMDKGLEAARDAFIKAWKT